MSIYQQVLSFIREPRAQEFEALALAVFRRQFDTVPAYRAYCVMLGVSPASVRSAAEAPAVSTVAFKYVELWPPAVAQEGRGRVFLTSGTTAGRERRGRHLVPELGIYRASAMGHLRRMLFADRPEIAVLSLHPTAQRMPESSLGQMISWAIEEFATAGSCCVADRGGVDLDAARRFLRQAERNGTAVCLMGTTAAFSALFEEFRSRAERFSLSSGSRIMDTGGSKGQALPLSAEQMHAEARNLLGIAEERVINEYGMTELCSQLYDVTALNRSGAAPARSTRSKACPPWMRPFVRDPVTLKPLAEGGVGLVSFFDLANVGSVAAVITEDLGFIENGLVSVLGRAQAADPRGCALGIAEFERAGAAGMPSPSLAAR